MQGIVQWPDGATQTLAARGHDVSLATISQALGMPKTSAFRYLRTLVEAGFVDHDPITDRYGSGARFRAMAQAGAALQTLRQHARPAMLALLPEFKETINLAVKDGVSAVYVEQVESPRSAGMRARIGDARPLHSTALGKAMLAFVPDVELAHYLDQPLIERTGRTLNNAAELRSQLRRVRRDGYATEKGENEDGATCIGVPLFDHVGYPIAALSISAPANRMPPSTIIKAANLLLEAARTLMGR
ncbi:IclR family transcriptional regulator [Devosia sp. A449]